MQRSRKTFTVLLTTAIALFGDPLAAQNSQQNFNGSHGYVDTSRSGPPKGWVFGGNASHLYQTWTDVAQELPVGRRCSIIAAGPDMKTLTHIAHGSVSSPEFATVMQSVSAEAYRGKRIRFSAQLSTVEVAGQAALWMRVDGQNGKVLSFDNMASRPVSGTKSWQRYDVVLDVPAESASIVFGFLLAGSGKVKAAEFTLDAVDASTATTAAGVPAATESLSKIPVNLDLHL